MTENNEAKAPDTLSDEQIRIAKAFVSERHEKGIGVTEFCSKYRISTKTFYEWRKNEVFESYLVALGGSIISDDERQAYQLVKKKIMAEATKANAGVREIQLFLDNFSYVVEAEKQERMKELGITPAHERQSEKSVEEKKLGLLARLKTADKPNREGTDNNE
ncbi:putative insertion element HTH domain-containing protein [Cytobacillus oceanisediminis]|uniref:Putative insertion element HTH domain-containing protein n=1 Tax=Cytobacillus oceanisediminis TaxID=665099 RepID=A0A2V2ZJV2_9BACI|nr:phBC6A51 family helix-turn-helix protein [Cytobacillus oceanisediminis]PWW20225.1 putative insertion element HTH domain-containing protein [Cytobacillus oceanisediminis]